MTSVETLASEKTSKKQYSYFKNVQFEHLAAGMTGGLSSTLILHPLDLLKIRFEVNDGVTVTAPKHSSIFGGLKLIYQQEGIKGLYRGVTPNLIGSGSSWGLYFLFYNSLKSTIQGGDDRIQLTPQLHIVCAAQAGILTLLITNPIWLMKTRLCLQTSQPQQVQLPDYKVYNSLTDAVRKIYRTEGILGFYKGLVPGLFGVSHGVVQFVTYEEMKNHYNIQRNRPINTKLGVIEYLTFAALSKMIAVSVTYPYQVVRARIQSQHQKYDGIIDCIKRTWSGEGVWGFYKGLGTNLLRVTPATMITFVTYEYVSRYLIKLRD